MICIIPQHAKSVRLPRKAFREICGIPLVAWSVIQARSAHCIDHVYVSTESQEIADICEPLGAEIIWRPKRIQDKAFAANVPLEHALRELGHGIEKIPFLTKLATSPLLLPGDIDRLYDAFMSAPDPPAGINKQAILACETQEGGVYRKYRKGSGYDLGRWVFYDKSHETLDVFGAMNVMYESDYFPGNRRAEWIYNADNVTDAAADQDIVFHTTVLGNGIFHYAPVELWQIAEIDDEAGFDLCEKFMDLYILKGRGKAVYDEYADRQTIQQENHDI